jgi:starvation-inducible DNA-binding protein
MAMKPEIGITGKNLEGVIAILSTALADEVTLYTKTRNFHWNVAGESFMELHLLFEKQYTELEEIIDEVAERIGKLGGKAIGTMAEFLQATRIKENPGKYPAPKDMIKILLHDHELFIRELRSDIESCEEKFKDAGTTDFLTGIMEQHETIAWKLRRYL